MDANAAVDIENMTNTCNDTNKCHEVDEQNVILSNLNSEDLEVTMVLSDFLTKFHSYCGIKGEECHLDGNGADNDGGNKDITDEKSGLHLKELKSSHGDHEKQNSVKSLLSSLTVIISPLDVLSALEYRQDLKRYRISSSLYHAATMIAEQRETLKEGNVKEGKRIQRQDCEETIQQHLTRRWAQDERKRLWMRMQDRIIPGRMSTDQDVSYLMTALQIKLAKQISTQLLLKIVNEPLNVAASTNASSSSVSAVEKIDDDNDDGTVDGQYQYQIVNPVLTSDNVSLSTEQFGNASVSIMCKEIKLVVDSGAENA
jgi:hypothetical protein